MAAGELSAGSPGKNGDLAIFKNKKTPPTNKPPLFSVFVSFLGNVHSVKGVRSRWSALVFKRY